MKKSVGIITLNDNNNFGNRLQNYAVQVVLNRLGLEAYSIENYPYMNFRKKYFIRKDIIRIYDFLTWIMF